MNPADHFMNIKFGRSLVEPTFIRLGQNENRDIYIVNMTKCERAYP